MCYCIYDADGVCELTGFNTGKTASGECSYTYSNPEDIDCDKMEEGWHEEEYEPDYPDYYYGDDEGQEETEETEEEYSEAIRNMEDHNREIYSYQNYGKKRC